jgi:hypothetical protein
MSKRLPPYWPNILITNGANSVTVETTVRIQHDGVWYDNIMCDRSYGPTPHDDPHQLAPKAPIGVPVECERELLQRFLFSVSIVQNFVKIDLNMVDLDGNSIFKPSEIQIDEKERLRDKWKSALGL